MKTQAKNTSGVALLRGLILLAIWALMTTIAALHQQTGGGPTGAPTVDTLCPMGGIATLYKVAAGGEFLQRVYPAAIVLFGLTVVLALILRRAFCGWICPLGAMQELAAWFGRKAGWHKPLLNNRTDKALRWIKYPILLLILALTYTTGELVFRPYDPWASYAHITAGWGELRDEFFLGTLLLALSLLVGLVIDRPWCRYLCPLGALLAPISKLGFVRITRKETTCIHCHKCERVCPVDISVEAATQVTEAECLACGKCVMSCPVPKTLQFKSGSKTLSTVGFGLLALVIFFGAIGITKLTGIWRSQPESLTEITGAGVALDPANLRGFMSLAEIEVTYGIPASSLLEQLGLPSDTPTSEPVNEVMKSAGREVEEVREAIRALLRQPPAALAPAQVESRTKVELSISGQMTFADICQATGLQSQTLFDHLTLPADTPLDKPVRDVMQPLGREVEEIRETVKFLATERKP